MAFFNQVEKSRWTFSERMNKLFRRGPKLDDDFWDDLEEALILSDLGAQATFEIIERLQDQAEHKALPDAFAVLDLLADEIASLFAEPDPDPFRMNPVCVLFVGINGAGKTTTVGKLANQASIGGRKVLIGSADTFRAAAIEQLDVWGERSGVEVVKRERGADPASVCYDVIERSEELRSDLILIDTSGRLHTSDELMRELQKVVSVTRKRATIDVKTVLVIDATTGQNGLQQAREFDKALDLDGVIMTKLDGTAKGGIAVAVSHELSLPILRIGVGEGIEDLQPFDAHEYAEALFGELRGDTGTEEAELSEDTEMAEERDRDALHALEPQPDETVSAAQESAPTEGDGYPDAPVASGELGHAGIPREGTDVFEAASDVYDEDVEEAELSEDVVSGAQESVPTEGDGYPDAPVASGELGHAGMPSEGTDVFEAASDVYDEDMAEDAVESEPEPEPESEPEPEKKESFRDKMRRWFS